MTKKPTLESLKKAVGGRERRAVPVGIEFQAEQDTRKIGMFIPFNSRSAPLPGFTEVIAPGAFAKSIGDKRSAKEGRDVVALWNHDPSQVLGRQANGTLTLTESERGLEGEVVLDPNNPMTAVYAAQIERGDVRGASFGFETIRDSWDYAEDGTATRTLQEVRLFDVSPVTFPAYPASEADKRALERAADDVAQLCAGIDLAELRALLAQVREGKAPLAGRSKLVAHITKLQSLVPPEPVVITTDWERKLASHERMLRVYRAMASVGGTEHPMEDFAYHPDPQMPSGWKLPIFDADHAQNALSRWNQTDMPDAAEKSKAMSRLMAACQKFKIDTTEFEKMHGPRSLRTYKRPTDGKTYDSFESCVADNGWADNPEGYCNSIKIGPGPGE